MLRSIVVGLLVLIVTLSAASVRAIGSEGYTAYWLAPSKQPAGDSEYGPWLLILRVPPQQLYEHSAGREMESSPRTPLLDQPGVRLLTYQKDSIWNADRQPIKDLGTFRVLESLEQMEIAGVLYDLQPATLQEAIRLLEHPKGTIPLHRLHGPLAGCEQTAQGLAALLKEQPE